jgi:hypothetical protein
MSPSSRHHAQMRYSGHEQTRWDVCLPALEQAHHAASSMGPRPCHSLPPHSRTRATVSRSYRRWQTLHPYQEGTSCHAPPVHQPPVPPPPRALATEASEVSACAEALGEEFVGSAAATKQSPGQPSERLDSSLQQVPVTAAAFNELAGRPERLCSPGREQARFAGRPTRRTVTGCSNSQQQHAK